MVDAEATAYLTVHLAFGVEGPSAQPLHGLVNVIRTVVRWSEIGVDTVGVVPVETIGVSVETVRGLKSA